MSQNARFFVFISCEVLTFLVLILTLDGETVQLHHTMGLFHVIILNRFILSTLFFYTLTSTDLRQNDFVKEAHQCVAYHVTFSNVS